MLINLKTYQFADFISMVGCSGIREHIFSVTKIYVKYKCVKKKNVTIPLPKSRNS